MSEWVKIHYLQWMLNNIYYVPDKNDLFFMYVNFGEDKKEEISADAALNLLILTMYVISRYEYC